MNDSSFDDILSIKYALNDQPFIPMAQYFALHIISCHKIEFILNSQHFAFQDKLLALCLTGRDHFQLLTNADLCCHSLTFLPTFVNSNLTIENLQRNEFITLQDCHDRDIMYHFLHIDRTGIITLCSYQYNNILNWMSSIHHLLTSSSDWWWTCRIRRFFLQIMYLIDESYFDYEEFSYSEKSPAETALQYIHNHYFDTITLNILCNLTNTNRTTLNKEFKQKTGLSPINYLTTYRIDIAKQLLSHTNLSLKEIAEATGFHYESQFSKTFYSKTGIRPGKYRSENKVSRLVFMDSH